MLSSLIRYKSVIIIIIIIINLFASNAHDTRSRNWRQKLAPENWRRFLAPVFHASCKISGARNQHGRIKSNQTFYLAIRSTYVK